MRHHPLTLKDLVALTIASLGVIVWLHIPSIYVRAMFRSGNTFTMAELWESMFLVRHLTPWVYDNSLVASLSFLHVEMDMSKLFLVCLALGYTSNFFYAAYADRMENGEPPLPNVLLPNVPWLNMVVLPYLLYTYMILLPLFHILAIPVIAYNIFGNGDTLHAVTLVIYLGTVGLTVLGLRET